MIWKMYALEIGCVRYFFCKEHPWGRKDSKVRLIYIFSIFLRRLLVLFEFSEIPITKTITNLYHYKGIVDF